MKLRQALVGFVVVACIFVARSVSIAQGVLVVQVPANLQWSYETPFSYTAGSLFGVTASGSWTSGTFTGGPDGMVGTLATPGYVLPGVNAYSLIGQIGSGAPFYIGTFFYGTANASGTLRLGMNDVPGVFGDNIGFVTASIPEPGSAALLGLAATFVMLRRRGALGAA